MKKKMCLWSLVLFALVSCNQVAQEEIPGMEMFEENPVSINWENPNKKELNSFQTNVSVYSMNNRDGATVLRTKYRLSLKMNSNKIYSRLDFANEFVDGNLRTIISDEEEMLLLNSNQVEYRIPLQEELSDLSFLGIDNAYSRINLDDVRKESLKLSFDINEKEKQKMIINIPNHYFLNNQVETRLSTQVMYDTTQETIAQIEYVSIHQDGTEVTTTIYPMYEEKDGIPIKIGSVTVVDSKAAELLDGFENIEYFNSIDEIPEISDEDFEALQELGEIEEVENMRYGNPADLSYQETIIEMYNDIEINNLDMNLFRIAEEF